MFDKVTRMKLRFPIARGNCSVEDLWDLTLTDLNTIAKSLRKKLKSTDEEDFLGIPDESTALDQLRFETVLHVLNVKKEEKTARETATAKKQERDKILAILAKKQDDALEKLSAEELAKKLEELK